MIYFGQEKLKRKRKQKDQFIFVVGVKSVQPWHFVRSVFVVLMTSENMKCQHLSGILLIFLWSLHSDDGSDPVSDRLSLYLSLSLSTTSLWLWRHSRNSVWIYFHLMGLCILMESAE